MTTESATTDAATIATTINYTDNDSTNATSVQQSYPVEQPFKLPMLSTAVLVLVPALLIYWFFGDSSSMPRSLKLFFGNWISPIILWFFAASFFHLLLKRGKLLREQQQTRSLSRQVLPSLLSDNVSDVPHAQLNQQLQQTPRFSIDVSDSIAGSNYFVTITVKVLDGSGLDFSNIVLHTVVTETDIEFAKF